MKKKLKNFLAYFFVIFFICLLCFLHLPKSKALALEVYYPTINPGPNESSVTDQSDLAQYLKYVFDIGIFIGFFAVFLSLIYAGVLYFLSPAIPNALALAKDRISGAVSGLLILVLLYLIITTINPALRIFKVGRLDNLPPPPEPIVQSIGVNLYASTDCSGTANTNTASIQDLGNLKNTINSVGIVPDSEGNLYFISILYSQTNYWGRCQYVDPNEKCSKVNIPVESASVYNFDFSPGGDGVYFYRKSFNGARGKEDNTNGGFLKISNSEIKNSKIYVGDLNNLTFTGYSSNYNNPNNCTVPEEEQDCVKWNNNGRCLNSKCPILGGKYLFNQNKWKLYCFVRLFCSK